MCVYQHAHMNTDFVAIELSQASGVPFYRQIFDQVAAAIRAGRLAPGAPLPSLRELSATLAVSLITTRRAFADLEAAGLVVQRQGQGTFVAEHIDARQRTDLLDEARRSLTVSVERALAAGLSAHEIREVVETALAPGVTQET
jgi:GntR family transcriptional regulator